MLLATLLRAILVRRHVRSFIMVVCLLPFLPVSAQAQRMASSYPNLQTFLDSCPQNDPYTPIIRRDFQITRDNVAVGDIACTEPYTQMPATEITDELSVIQTLRFMYYMDMGRSGYLPWTPLRLYDWVKSRVSGVNISTRLAGGECCSIINNVKYINVGSLAAAAAADGTSVAVQAQYRQTAIGQAANVGFFAHEARHTEGNGYPHVSGCPAFPMGGILGCDQTYDVTNLYPYAIQYYLAEQMLTGGINLGYSCDPTARAEGAAFQSLANGFIERFVTNAPPQLSLPAAPGGACIPASTFTSDSIPSQVNVGASLIFGVSASNSQAGWTADSAFSWITPIAGMNSVGSGQAVFSLSPNSSAQSGTVVAAGTIVSVTCASSICTLAVVNGKQTATALVSSLNPEVDGESVTFTATVTSTAGTPTGSVTFKDGAATLGTEGLSSGQATFTTSALAVGTHSVTAVYNGDVNFIGSTSAVLTETVAKAATSTSVSSSLNPEVDGESVTFTATVTSTAGSTLTGSVTFKDGTATLGTEGLSSGQATFTTSALAVGTHSVTAVYNGDVNFIGSTSAVLTETVAKAATSKREREREKEREREREDKDKDKDKDHGVR